MYSLFLFYNQAVSVVTSSDSSGIPFTSFTFFILLKYLFICLSEENSSPIAWYNGMATVGLKAGSWSASLPLELAGAVGCSLSWTTFPTSSNPDRLGLSFITLNTLLIVLKSLSYGRSSR